MKALGTAQLHKFFVQRDGHLRSGSGQKVGAAALFAVAVQGELGYDQQLPLHLVKTPVHLAVFVLENAKACQLVRQLDGLGLGILMGDPQQDQKALPDLAMHFSVDGDGGVLHAGQYSAHNSVSFIQIVL